MDILEAAWCLNSPEIQSVKTLGSINIDTDVLSVPIFTLLDQSCLQFCGSWNSAWSCSSMEEAGLNWCEVVGWRKMVLPAKLFELQPVWCKMDAFCVAVTFGCVEGVVVVFYKQLVDVHLEIRTVSRTVEKLETHFVPIPLIFCVFWRDGAVIT